MSQPLGHKSTAIIVMFSGGTENQVRIQDLVKGAPGQSCRHSEAESHE